MSRLFICLLLSALLGVFTNLEAQKNEVFIFGKQSMSTVNTSQIKQLTATHGQLNHDRQVLVFLGNFYDEDEDKILENLGALLDTYAKVYLIPGKKEWDELGAKKIKKFEDKINDRFDTDIIIPDNGCGELETKDLEDDVVIGAIDSEWYLRDWTRDVSINEGCEIKNREQFWKFFEDDMGGLKEKLVLLFVFHPMLRYDEKGGHNPLEDHLFPLAEYIPGAYIPLPLIGTIFQHTESYLKGENALTNPQYRDYADGIIDAVEDHKKMVVISSEGNFLLQQKHEDGIFLNVNSAGESDFTNTKIPNFASQEKAFLRIQTDSNLVDISFFSMEKGREGELLHHLRDERPEIIKDKVQPSEYLKDTTGALIAQSIYEPGEIYNLNGRFFGTLNTNLYFMSIKMKPLDMKRHLGGLKPTRLGGGRQTTSLRFEDKNEHEYVGRSMIKRPQNLLPSPFNKSIFKDLTQYYFTASNPFAFMAMARLETASNIYHAEHELMYLPYQKALVPYNDEIGGNVIQFSQRADGDWRESDNFGHTREIIGTDDVLEEVRENDAIIDAEMFLRARLLDLIANDWDRHPDQWRWARDTVENDTVDTYYPIPRDRDQAFSNYNGIMMALARPYNIGLSTMRPFDEHLSRRQIKYMHESGALLDNQLLNELDWIIWKKNVDFLKEKLTPEVIRNAVEAMPQEIAEEKEEVYKNLVARVKELETTAAYFYAFLNEVAVIPASYEKDSIVVERRPNRCLQVTIKSEVDDDEWVTKFERLYSRPMTKEVIILGMEGKDVIVMSGKNAGGPKVRIVGGFDKDEYYNEGIHKSKRKNVIYDDRSENKYALDGAAKVIKSDKKELHALDRHDFQVDYHFFIPTFGYNSDDGLFIGTGFSWFDFEFKRKNAQNLKFSYAEGTDSWRFGYSGVFSNQLREHEYYLEADWYGPIYTFNYFGMGNDTPINLDIDRSYYFVRKEEIRVEGGIQRQFSDLGRYKLGLSGSAIEIQKTENRFIGESDLVNPEVYKTKFFTSANFEVQWENLNSTFKPTNGVNIRLGAEVKTNLSDGLNTFVKINTAYDLYKSFDAKERFVYSTRIGFNHIIGDFYFYDAHTIGGSDNLRGFRRERFTGRTTFYHNNNLHIKVLNDVARGYFPFSAGVTLCFDHGRVWADQGSTTWHYSYGGGIWISPLDKLVLTGGFFVGTEENRIRVKFGWLF